MYGNDTWSDVLTNVKDVYYDNSRGIDSNSADARINSIANRVLGNRYDTVDMSAKLFGNRNNRTEIVDGEYSIISDAIGNITSYKGFTYSYLGRQLTGLYNNESGILYSYNADGQRISKSYDSIGGFALDYDYYYNGSTLAGFRLYITEGVDTQEYLVSFMYDENGEPFGFTVDGNSYYYVRNAQNDIFSIVNSDNQGVVLYQYDAWGNVTACYDTSEGSILSLVNPYTYRGYYYDIETGYYYLNSRYYSPQLHRFISADNAISCVGGSVLGYNQFAYCFNNPTNLNDSNGNWPEWVKKATNKVKQTYKKIVNKIKNKGIIRYNVPLYNQGTRPICWAYSQTMVESFRNGSNMSQQEADLRAEALANEQLGSDWEIGGTPTNLGSKVKVKNKLSIYSALVDNGPLYCRYHDADNNGHLVVITGVDIWNDQIFTNNPWGIQGTQSYEEFVNGFAGMPQEFGMTLDAVYIIL